MARLKEERAGARKASKYLWTADAAPRAPVRTEKKQDKKEKSITPATAAAAAPGAPEAQGDDIQTILVQNPNVNAATFLNLLKSKGYTITKETQNSLPQLDRAKESAAPNKKSFVESNLASVAAGGNPNRFRVVLIQEGLGNTKDGYFYTKDALKSAVPVFEGKKMYLDHPSRTEETDRPERSVKDIGGHFEKIEYKEAQDGTARLEADCVVPGDSTFDRVRTLMGQAIKYSKQFPDKDFVGLSINASGDAEPMEAAEFLSRGGIVPSAMKKIQEAMGEGLTQIKVVKLIDSAVSCDLVTEAGAKGKVLELLEGAKAMDDKKMKQDEAEEKKEGDDAAGKDDKKGDKKDAGHDDEEKDKALIMDQLKKHGLSKDGEENEEAMKAAKHMHAAYKAAGYESEEAASRACEAMKCSGHAADSMKQADGGDKDKDAEKKEAEEKKEGDDKKKQESADVLKLKGENAKLRESLGKIEVEKHLDKKLQESKLPMSVTKRFREAAKACKSIKEVDDKFNLFMEGYRATGGEADLSTFVAVEKEQQTEGEGISLADCVDE